MLVSQVIKTSLKRYKFGSSFRSYSPQSSGVSTVQAFSSNSVSLSSVPEPSSRSNILQERTKFREWVNKWRKKNMLSTVEIRVAQRIYKKSFNWAHFPKKLEKVSFPHQIWWIYRIGSRRSRLFLKHSNSLFTKILFFLHRFLDANREWSKWTFCSNDHCHCVTDAG